MYLAMNCLSSENISDSNNKRNGYIKKLRNNMNKFKKCDEQITESIKH